MIKLIKHNLTNGRMALGVTGDTPEEIKQEIDALFNWGCWGGQKQRQMENDIELAHETEYGSIQYVFTDVNRLRRGLTSRLENRLLNDENLTRQYKGKRGGIHPLAVAEMERTLATIETKSFLTYFQEIE